MRGSTEASRTYAKEDIHEFRRTRTDLNVVHITSIQMRLSTRIRFESESNTTWCAHKRSVDPVCNINAKRKAIKCCVRGSRETKERNIYNICMNWRNEMISTCWSKECTLFRSFIRTASSEINETKFVVERHRDISHSIEHYILITWARVCTKLLYL